MYKKGQVVQAVVLNIDKENERFSLGIKQLTTDPWEQVPVKYKPGTRITGTVTNVTDFGIFLELEEGIEGLIHVSELTKDKSGNPLSRFKVDDVIQAKVINISQKDKKIGLSIKRLEESDEREIYKSYFNNRQEATSNLGELLKKGMMDIENQVRSDETNTDSSVKEQGDRQNEDQDTEISDELQTASRDTIR